MTTHDVVRRLAAIFVADAAGYTRHIVEDELASHNHFKRDYSELFEPAIGRFRGRLIKKTGDGFLVEFSSVVDAVECAVHIQSQKTRRRDAQDEDPGLDYRIGINVGEIIVESDDIYGDDVNIAFRIEQLVEPGNICLTSAAFESVRNRLDLGFESLGSHQVKNILEPIGVYRVTLDQATAGGPEGRRPARSLPSKPSIALLPFINMSGGAEWNYFSDGITNDLITELSRFKSLFVIARNSSFAFQNKPVNVREIGRDLGVQYIMEGSIRRAVNRVRITVQLVDAQTGTHLWAERYDRDMEDIFAVQDEVTRTIVATLVGRVESDVLQRAKRKPTEVLAAYDYLLQGLDHFNRLTQEDNAQAAALFAKAIELDPEYALAYAHLASTCMYQWFWEVSLDPLDERADEHAKKAIELDEEESRCHMIYGRVQLYRRNFGQALHHHERGVNLNPNDADGAAHMGMLLTFMGNPEDGISWLEHAMRLNPYHPDWYFEDLGQSLYTAGRYREAADIIERVATPPLWLTIWLAACYGKLGQRREAEALVGRIVAVGADIEWERFAKKEPFQHHADMENLLDGLRVAGLIT
ncbi:MAG: adenylate/guanylate cyclase domain-containing protein [Kiloniellales bacterium]|nr:adenylate/guanylate cyclase domain-containing protein [Kiloniellales bacterium]